MIRIMKALNECIINEELSREDFVEMFTSIIIDLMLSRTEVIRSLDIEGIMDKHNVKKFKGLSYKALRNKPELIRDLMQGVTDYFAEQHKLDSADKIKVRRLIYKYYKE